LPADLGDTIDLRADADSAERGTNRCNATSDPKQTNAPGRCCRASNQRHVVAGIAGDHDRASDIECDASGVGPVLDRDGDLGPTFGDQRKPTAERDEPNKLGVPGRAQNGRPVAGDETCNLRTGVATHSRDPTLATANGSAALT